MNDSKHLKDKLRKIDTKGYKAYKDIKGSYDFTLYQLFIDHVQGDPYSTASRIRVRVDRRSSGLKEDTTESVSRCIALRDFLTRQFFQACRKISRGNRGIGQSGLITIDKPCQEILDRSSMIINDNYVEARFFIGLPAFGRRISGRNAEAMFFEELPRIVETSLFFKHLDSEKVYTHIRSSEDADFLRSQLDGLGLIAFVAEDALLPRASGINPAPLAKETSVLFNIPKGMEVVVDLPNQGRKKGMGLQKGVTLIVGGGYHGKSTLLNALELGIYNHIPGDGRELVVTIDSAVKIRAADGRSIKRTDISPFINNLPFNKDTVSFSTENASGSTSQAAGISEAVETGATVLLLDEDTSATNFMIRDFRMQQLVTKEYEPITPFVDKVKHLYAEKGISTVLVMGGSGDYFSVADHVIQMTDYTPKNVTEKAKEIAAKHVTGRIDEGSSGFGRIKERIPDAQSLNPVRENGRMKISARGRREILFGPGIIDCWDLEQVVDVSQTRAIGYAIYYATRYMDGRRTLKQVLDQVVEDIDTKGLDILPPFLTGDLACFRIFELAAAINRMRTLNMTQKS
ncbi:MAG: ABC-ATPase domain-containing protein [Desulfobacterales bacterium]|nr:ABC-ATPase domain-containing protein [Desulfobacterales bacterium]